MKNTHKTTLTPKLRFPEFRKAEGWEAEPMCELYSFKGTFPLSRDQLNNKNGTVKIIHYGDIHTKYSSSFKIFEETVPYINPSKSLDNVSEDNYCVEGDIIFADASEDLEDVGKSIEIVALNNERLLSGMHTILARQKGRKIIVGFGCYLFKSGRIRNQIRKEAQGAKVFGISASRLSNIEICYPVEKAEQRKIASCLSSLDELIAAHARKLDALKLHKKGLMQNLFPREGESTPRLRFPEFENAGEWEDVPLGKLAKRITTKNALLSQAHVLTNSAELGIVDQGSYFDREIVTKSNLGSYYIVESGDFVYNPRVSTLAPVGPISRNNLGTGVMSPLYTVFRFSNPHTDYFAHLFKTAVWHTYLKESSNSGARHDRMSISAADFMNLPIPVPSSSEQHRIATCLSSLDELISAQSQKLEVLKMHKKGLMQNLFPSAAEVGG